MKRTKKRISLSAACLGLFLAITPSPSSVVLAADEETPDKIIAAQIKRQGYACDRPEKAVRDRERSKPNAAVWVLTCESGRYRVRLVPDMAAHVERLE